MVSILSEPACQDEAELERLGTFRPKPAFAKLDHLQFLSRNWFTIRNTTCQARASGRSATGASNAELTLGQSIFQIPVPLVGR